MTLAVTLVSIGAGIGACGIIWRKVIRPSARAIRKAVHLIDMLEVCAPYLKSMPDTLPVLAEIAKEFRPNEGASLRDQMNRIEYTVGVNACQINLLRKKIETFHGAVADDCSCM